MTVVPVVPSVSIFVSVRCFGNSGACSAPGVLGVCCWCFGDMVSLVSVVGALVIVVPVVPLVSLVSVVSVRCCCDSGACM